MITKQQIIDRKIFLSDNILSEKELVDFWFLATSCDYKYGQRSDSRVSQIHRRLAHHIDPFEFVKTTVWHKLEKFFEEPVGVKEAYINYSEFSTATLPHCDNTEDEPSILISLNQEWKRDWGGYTAFFKGMHSNTISKAICPAPGQVIIFNGSVWHYALPPVHFAPCARFMLALKLRFV